MKKIQILILLIFMSSSLFSQRKYINDFEQILTEKEFKEMKKNKKGRVFNLKNNTRAIIPDFFKGTINDSLKHQIIAYLRKKSSLKISNKDTVIVDFSLSGRCNVVNSSNFKKYISAVSKKTDYKLLLMVEKYDRSIKKQLIDDLGFIKDNFFKYYKWKKSFLKCGGTIVIFPNNKFIRFQGEYDPMEVLLKIENN